MTPPAAALVLGLIMYEKPVSTEILDIVQGNAGCP
jgi:hypothetical protein